MKKIEIVKQEIEVDNNFISALEFYGVEYYVVEEDAEGDFFSGGISADYMEWMRSKPDNAKSVVKELNHDWPPNEDNILF